MNETTELKLRKVLETKANIKQAINNKGGNITDDTPFDEYPTQIDNISAGGGSGEGIVKLVEKVIIDTIQPIPTSGTFDYIVFNTALSESEVVDIIKNAKLKFNDYLGGMSIYIVCSNESAGITLAILDAGTAFGTTDAYAITIMGNDEVVLFVSSNLKDSFGFSGWNTKVFAMLGGNILPAGIEAESTAMGYPVGLQNKAIKQIINCGGSIVDTGEVQTVKELSGEYYLQNHTVTPQESTTYNILDLIGEKVETKKEGSLLISSPDTIVEKIFFNTELSNEDIVKVLDTIELIDNKNIYPSPFYVAYANSDLSKCITIVVDNGTYFIGEGNFNTGAAQPLFMYPEVEGMVGWLLQNKEYPIGQVGISRVDILGLDIGNQNDKLTSLISMNNDFEEVTTSIKKVFPKEITIETISENDVAQKILSGAKMGTIVIPGSVKIIDERQCSQWGMEEVVCHDNMTQIMDYGFYFCDYLKCINIPKELSSIGEHCFERCGSLESITFETRERALTIYMSAFEDCYALTNVFFKDTLEKWLKINLKDAYSNPMCYASHFYMLDENNEYYEVTSIAIPNTITNINNFTFYGFKHITNITIPDSVTSIGHSAFSNCTSLTSIVIPDGVTSIENSAFNGCTSLTSIIIPDSVTSIGLYVFNGCSLLESVTIGNNVTILENGVFEKCSSLKNITIPNSVTIIGDNVFYECTSLTSIEIPNSVNQLGQNSFRSCTSLKSITIPNSVTRINSGSFLWCNSLTDVYFKGTEEQWNTITIESGNEALTNATIHFNYEG